MLSKKSIENFPNIADMVPSSKSNNYASVFGLFMPIIKFPQLSIYKVSD